MDKELATTHDESVQVREEPLPYVYVEPEFPNFEGRRRVVAIVVLVLIGLLSFFVLGELASSPDVHGSTISKLDEKKNTVMTLVAGSSGTSTAITLLPGDAGTPIAEKLMDLSSDFLIVIAAIYLEKYLLTIIGFVTFKVVVPVACALLCVVVLIRGQSRARMALTNIVMRVVFLSVAMFFVVPASVFLSGMIEQTYQASLSQTLQDAEQTATAIEKSAKEQDAATGEKTEEKGILETLQDIPNTIQQLPSEVGNLIEQGKRAVNNFIEALAVMIVTSCIIPILVLVFFLWLSKAVLGVSIDLPMTHLRPRSLGRKGGSKSS